MGRRTNLMAAGAVTMATAIAWAALTPPRARDEAAIRTVDAAPTAPLTNPLGPQPGTNDPSAPADGTLIRHDLAVTEVDPLAVQAPNKHSGVPNRHLALAPTDPAARKGRLFVFVGGTNSSETITQEIMYAGARRGYHALAIAYPNDAAVAMLCLASTDDDCTGKVREEILTGTDLSPLVAIAPRDALETRLRTALAHLAATYPDEGWNQYLGGGAIDWSRVSAVGHSQGAGHVALLAKRHAMFRSVMISGVADLTALAQPAPWLSRANATPVDRQYGFTHVADYVVPVAIADASWNAIGLQAFGPMQPTDGRQPGYGGSHKLLTALLPAAGANPHVAMLDDGSMPRAADGSPAHRLVWVFVAFP